MPQPNFLIVGAPKCGTTSLYEYLGQHPDVFFPPIKEPCFFSDGAPRVVHSLDEYRALFHGHRGQRAIGEASASYLYDAAAPGRILDALGPVRILVLLRDPVQRAYSSWANNVYQVGYEKLDFAAALEAEATRMASPDFAASCPFYPGGYYYFHLGLYHDPLKRYIDAFGRDRVQVHLFEDLAQHPDRLCRQVFTFLDVDPAFRPVFQAHNAAPAARHAGLHRLLLQPPGALRRLLLRMPVSLRMRCYGLARRLYRANLTTAKRPPLDPALRAGLQARYRDDLLRLQNLIGRDLSSWIG